MIKVIYTASFVKGLKRVERKDEELFEETLEKMELFKDRGNHSKLRVHKLHGRLANYWSFSINYKFRILYRPVSGDQAIFHDIGDHDVYK